MPRRTRKRTSIVQTKPDDAPGIPPSGTLPVQLLMAVFPMVAVLGCGDEGAIQGDIHGPWRAERDTVGDTVVVRTLSGSIWGDTLELSEELRIGRLEGPAEYVFGSIDGLAVGPDGSLHVVDQQASAIRRYTPDGSWTGTIGRRGEGPGEIGNTDGGIAVDARGRVAIRDPGNARLTVYSPEGESLSTWPIPGGHFTNTPLFSDTAGTVYPYIFELTDEGTRAALLPIDLAAGPGDTIPYPDLGHTAPLLEAVRVSENGGRSRNQRNVPFSAVERWIFSPLGYFVGGVSSDYRIDLLRPHRPLRIERLDTPVTVKDDERDEQREFTQWVMRFTDPTWTWEGPSIPGVKPWWKRVWTDLDGRVWIQRHVEAQRVPAAERREPNDLEGRPETRWYEPVVFDVFRPDGQYLGPVRFPREIQLFPQPVIRGETVWAMVEDDLGVQRVARFRMTGLR